MADKTPENLRERRAAIDLSDEEFRKLGHDLVDQVADFLQSLPERPVTPAEKPSEVRALIDENSALPGAGADPSKLLPETAKLLFDHSLFNGHPKFWGYITSSPAPLGMLADFLASATNPNLGGWMLAPIATEIEAQTVRWIADFLGYPRDCGGILVSGGNMANFVGFLAARRAIGGEKIRAKGTAANRLTVYAASETHTWIQKAADLFGLGTDAIRWIPVDEHQRIRLDKLKEQLDADESAGFNPMMIVGSAGTVSTGAIDPLPELAKVCKEHGIWFHVDGAYGGFAAAVDEVDDDIRGLSLADSVAVDPHKWLYSPLEAGCAIVRQAEHLPEAFSYHPPYYHLEQEVINYVDYGMQNSRGFRALKVWLTLKQVGRAGFAQMIRDDIVLARAMYDAFDRHEEFEAMTHSLSIATFRYVPERYRGTLHSDADLEYLNELNEDIMERLERSGEAYVSKAIIDGVFALRACIVNFRTSLDDVEALPAILSRLGAEADRELAAGKS